VCCAVCACFQAAGSWSKERCCVVQGNSCGTHDSFCYDSTASSNYLYRLSPGDPKRYEPTGRDTNYQYDNPSYWPTFGGDLNTGADGPPGTSGYCNQYAYAANSNEVCGSYGNWDHTNLEVWRLR
jgi:hypothetical protein